MNPTLSVIIPNYNNELYIEKCILSIISQSYSGLLEIIIVDDCSTDSSRRIISELAAKYPIIKPIFLKQNGKVSAARNRGLNEARGEYVTFIDADDYYYDNNKLEHEMKLIQLYNSRGKDIAAYSAIVRVSNDGKNYSYPKIHTKQRYQGNIYYKLIFDIRSDAVMRDYCIRKQLLMDVGGYNSNNSLFEDYELLLKLAKNTEFYYTETNGTVYRESINGLSQKPKQVLFSKKNDIIYNQIQTEPFLKRMILMCIKSIVSSAKSIVKNIRG